MTATHIDNDAALVWQRLRRSPTQPDVWFDLALSYAKYGLPWQAGYAARQALRIDATLATALDALAIPPWRDPATGDGLLGRATLPQSQALAKRFFIRVCAHPGDWLSWLYLARLLEMPVAPGDDTAVDGIAADPFESGLPTAQSALDRARGLEPLSGESLHWIGVWRLNAGAAQNAVAALSGLLDIRPVRHGSMMYLGEALIRTGNVIAAEKAFARASLSVNPSFLMNLAARVYAHNYWQEAIALLEKASDIKPDDLPILLALARLQSDVYALADCRTTLTRALTLEPGNHAARLLEAGMQGRMGDAKSHLMTLQSAYDTAGDPLSRLASSIAMTLLYQDCTTAAAARYIADSHRRLCAPIEAAFAQKTVFTNDRTPSRRLRIGCVTGDLHRQHPVNIFMLPLLQRIDHVNFDVCIYYAGTTHDEYTRQAQQTADKWLDVASFDDATLQAAIVADEVDILLDLAGHTANHRLGLFAMRAAPVQATFLGYPHSTGLSSIDWIIGDATVSPAEHAPLFSEGIAQLPHSVFCWAPVDDYPLPPVRPATAPKMFGSFNNAMKLSPRTIALWARILRAVPDAGLLLKAPSLRDPAVQRRFTDLFVDHGIDAGRLTFQGPSGLAEMMQAYGEIDVALDPTPYNGGTTSLQALWMGVPVITLAGENFATRMGMSFMQTLGQADWIANDEAAYGQAAAQLMSDCQTIRQKRPSLRAQMAASHLCDIQSYARNFEALLQRMWIAYCEGSSCRLLPAIEDNV
jgi:protein O-GlcNAc transferase